MRRDARFGGQQEGTCLMSGQDKILHFGIPIKVMGHKIRTIRSPFRGIVQVAVIRPSARGGEIVLRWKDINQLGINRADLDSAFRKQMKGAVSLF